TSAACLANCARCTTCPTRLFIRSTSVTVDPIPDEYAARRAAPCITACRPASRRYPAHRLGQGHGPSHGARRTGQRSVDGPDRAAAAAAPPAHLPAAAGACLDDQTVG